VLNHTATCETSTGAAGQDRRPNQGLAPLQPILSIEAKTGKGEGASRDKHNAGRTPYRQVERFDTLGMRSLFAPLEKDRTPRPTLSPRLGQLIVDLKAEYPPLHLHEIARICYVAEGRRPSPHTIQRVLAAGPAPTRLGRRYPPYAENVDPAEARLAIIRLHAEGWRVSTIAAYLECSRQQVYGTLHRWIAEGREGLDDKPRTRTRLALKTTLGAMHAVRELQRNPELGAFRVHAALKREGILLSPRTCGRIMALNSLAIYAAFEIKKERIDKRQAWQSYVETLFNMQHRMADYRFAQATSWVDMAGPGTPS